jgi:pimeloyl-ACP methyl ester carboxylesterase
MPEDRDVIRTGAELVRCDTDRWLTPRDITAPLVICIHGFTSHGRYLVDLARYIEGNGFVAALFNYDSYRGIDRASADLLDRLQPLMGGLANHSFILVGHSMGGLVARFFARNAPFPLGEALKGMALLGTPNKGISGGRQIVSYMLNWADWLTGPNPYARSVIHSRASQQLTLSDPNSLIELLNRDDRQAPLEMSILSVAGGRPFLEFGRSSNSSYAGTFQNRVLQRLIGENPNDGLVEESSADITKVIGNPNGLMQHNNTYTDYLRINHTHLVHNQGVANVVVRWLQAVMS